MYKNKNVEMLASKNFCLSFCRLSLVFYICFVFLTVAVEEE